MIRDPNAPLPPPIEDETTVPRIFLREPGWKVAMKVGNDREFCHNIAPGDDTYHRLSDGEVIVCSPDERLCLPCAERRGLLHFEPRGLREPGAEFKVDGNATQDDTIPVADRDDG